MKLVIDGKEQQARIFDSMWEYVDHYGSDITHYRLSLPKEGERIVRSFKPIDDETFSTHSSDLVEIDGKHYQAVWWGEDEISLIPESELMATLWTVYEWDQTWYACTGQIFRTREEAEEAAQ